MSTQDKPEGVVVTGSSGGVGRAIAHAFAKRGAHVGLLALLLTFDSARGRSPRC